MAIALDQSWLEKVRGLRIRRDAPPLYGWLWALLALLLILAAVRLIWIMVTPVEPYGDWQPSGAEIIDPAARSMIFSRVDPFNRTAVQETDNTIDITSLQLTLYGIRINQASGQGSAIIGGEDGVQTSYNVGEEVMPGVTLSEVAFDFVVLSRNGAKESLYLDQSIPAETVGSAGTGGAPAPSGDYIIDDGAAQPVTADSLRSAVNFAPRTDNGQVTGLTVSPNGNGQLFTATGFRAGDVIVGVNGTPIRSAADVGMLMNQIKPGARLSVEVERGAAKLPIAIVIPE